MKFTLALFVIFLTALQSFSQTDVTNDYLTNAGFDANFNYPVTHAEAVITTAPGTMGLVNGWTSGPVIDWTVAGTFEYGWTGTFNGASVPTSGQDGTNGPGSGALGISVGWGNSVYYNQSVTLPKGNYSLKFALYFQGGSSIQNNLIGWIPSSGTPVYSEITTVNAQGEWITGTVDFTLSEETSGNIQVGMQANGEATSSAMARMYIDYVSLTYFNEIDILVEALNTQKETAQTNAAIQGPGIYNVDELNAAITNANAIDLENTTEEELQLAIDVLETANNNASDILEEYAPLTESINNATTYAENTFYPGRNVLEQAIANAQTVYNSPDDQSENIETAVSTLNEAVNVYIHSGTVDVTETYLQNAGFNENCTYLVGGTQTVGTTDPGTLNSVTGWTAGAVPAWSVAGTFEYGWNGDFNGVTSPSSGVDGSSGSGQGALGLTVGWGNSLSYSQSLTLPPGKYTLEYAALFQGTDNLNNNLTGWVPNSGAAVLSDMTTAVVGQWVKSTISFTVIEETSGNIQVGMQAHGVTSSSNPRVFIDYVKLLNNLGDKTDLEILSDSASFMLDNPENVPEGSTVYQELATVQASAQVVLNDETAVEEAIISAENELKEAIANVHTAILTYNTSGATADNPIDLSYKIINPDFELNGGSTTGWTTTLGIFEGGNTAFVGAPSPNHVLDGTGSSSTTGYQTIVGMPQGVYRVKAVARGRVESNASMYIGVETGNTFGSEEANRVATQVNRIGDAGGSLNFGFNPYETPFLLLQNGIDELTMGIYFENNNGWSSADNFELYFYGSAENVVASLKADLTSLKDSTNLPEGYNVSEFEALLNTELTNENASSLIADLENGISELQNVISENIDTTLSDIKVDGVTLKNFSPEVYLYTYNIHTSSPEMPDVPTVTVTEKSSYAQSTLDIAEEVPGSTTITVKAGNGDTQLYSIDFDAVQLIKYENYTTSFNTLKNVFFELSGVGQLTLTGSNDPLDGSTLNLTSTDAWIYFQNMKPSEVVNSQLVNIKVNGQDAVNGTNIWVAQYLNGAMVIPHSNTFEPLTVYADKNLGGTAQKFRFNAYYKASQLGSMNDNIESFTLKKGYMATFASNPDGTGISRVYIADNNDLTIKSMPEGLSNTASFLIVRKWRWTTKKAWRGSSSDAVRFGAGSHYDYNNAARSTLDVEYIPMRHNPNWNAYSNFLDKHNSTHALGYNEPDNSVDDGFSSVEDAIAAWPNMMASGHRLGSPATTDGGLNWLYSFLDECEARNYRVDFVAWHFYRSGYTPQGLYNALKAIHDRTGRPLWITEWNNGCNWTYDGNNPAPGIEENGEVIAAFTAIMDTCSFVERYFVWDGCNETLRMTNSGTGELYPAGVAYRDQVSTMAYSMDFYNSATDLGGTIIQENAAGLCQIDGSIANNYGGYTGPGYTNTEKEAGKGINWEVVFPTDGTQTLTFRYAMDEDRYANIIINDTLVADSVLFPATPSPSQWINLPVNVTTQGGIAKIRLESANNNGLPFIDYLQVTNISSSKCNSSVNRVSFEVLDGENPIVGAIVEFNRNAYKTDENGQVSIDYVARGVYNLSVTAEGYSVYNDLISVNGEDITETLNLLSLGVNDALTNDLTIYPNPASGNVNLTSSLGLSNLKVYDSLGRMVLTVQGNETYKEKNLDVSNLNQGVYFLHFKIGTKVYIEKLILK